jgi:hypothetical protein
MNFASCHHNIEALLILVDIGVGELTFPPTCGAASASLGRGIRPKRSNFEIDPV